MNKIKLFFLAAVIVAGVSRADAQKSGYISVEQVVSLMPELGKIDTALQRFQVDSLNNEFADIVRDYNYRDSIMKSKDTVRMSAAIKTQHRQEMDKDAYQIQNWQQISQNVMQSKQQELLAPVYQKVMGAINAVAKENGYSFVYNQEVLLVAPPSDNLLPLVAKKLNVKLPPSNQGTQGPVTNPTPPKTTPKPTTRH